MAGVTVGTSVAGVTVTVGTSVAGVTVTVSTSVAGVTVTVGTSVGGVTVAASESVSELCMDRVHLLRRDAAVRVSAPQVPGVRGAPGPPEGDRRALRPGAETVRSLHGGEGRPHTG